MTTKSDESGGGVMISSPVLSARQNPKNISPPAHCRTCTGQFYIFRMPGHPDDGEVFSCSVMLENMKVTGSRPFACSYRNAPAQKPIIDAEDENIRLRKIAALGFL